MDYRSPFELRQQILEDAKASMSPHGPSSTKRKKNSPTHTNAAKADSLDSKFMPSTSLPDDPTALVREVPGAENIRAMNEALAREEAVQRYVERENLSLEDSATYIMKNGSTGQRISFLSRIKDSLMSLSQKRISKVLAILLDSMWTQDPELQCRAPEIIIDFLGLLSVTTAAELLEVVKTMLTVKTATIRIAWGKLLLRLPGCLKSEVLEEDLMQLASKKSEHSQPQDQRELSCDMLGVVCEFMDRAKVSEVVVPRALALCHDTNVGVRQHICQQLGIIARSLGVDAAREKIAPDLFELLQDEECGVSQIAFSCLLDLVEFFGPDFRKERLYPIIKSYIERPPKEVFSLLIGEFGRFLVAIKGDISSKEDVLLFAKFFQSATEKPEPESRKHCAFNFPAVVDSLPRYVFPTHLRDCLIHFSRDPLPEVRRSAAAGLHELVPILKEQAAEWLEVPFLTLFEDKDFSVRIAFFRHISTLLDCFVKQLPAAKRKAFFHKVGDCVLTLAASGEANFHNMQFALIVVAPYQKYFATEMLVERLVPLLMNYVKRGANVLKDDCASLVMRVAASCEDVNTTVGIFSKVNNDFARSSSCYQRQSYFRFIREASRCFSCRCIRERFFENSMELQRDSVSCVRLSLAYSLPFLSKGLRRDTKGAFEEEFNNMMQRLLMDDDEAVRTAAVASQEALEKASKELSRSPTRAQEEESENARREKAEQAMLDIAKENDKAERRAKLRDMLKNDRERDVFEAVKTSSLKQRVPISSSTSPAKRTGTKTTPAPSATGRRTSVNRRAARKL